MVGACPIVTTIGLLVLVDSARLVRFARRYGVVKVLSPLMMPVRLARLSERTVELNAVALAGMLLCEKR